MATSGNQAADLKGTTTVGDVTVDAGAAGLFAALFAGMQLVESRKVMWGLTSPIHRQTTQILILSRF